MFMVFLLNNGAGKPGQQEVLAATAHWSFYPKDAIR
jgi:hypothetical protein